MQIKNKLGIYLKFQLIIEYLFYRKINDKELRILIK